MDKPKAEACPVLTPPLVQIDPLVFRPAKYDHTVHYMQDSMEKRNKGRHRPMMDKMI